MPPRCCALWERCQRCAVTHHIPVASRLGCSAGLALKAAWLRPELLQSGWECHHIDVFGQSETPQFGSTIGALDLARGSD